VSDAEVRMQDHDAYDLIEGQFNQELDGSLGPSGPDSLFRYVAEILVHHAEAIALKSDSYRLKDRDLGRVPTAAADEQ
jgi:hypothetical protein